MQAAHVRLHIHIYIYIYIFIYLKLFGLSFCLLLGPHTTFWCKRFVVSVDFAAVFELTSGVSRSANHETHRKHSYESSGAWTQAVSQFHGGSRLAHDYINLELPSFTIRDYSYKYIQNEERQGEDRRRFRYRGLWQFRRQCDRHFCFRRKPFDKLRRPQPHR